MKYEINQKVIHCYRGLLRITGTTVINDRDYYLLTTDKGDSETIYVPVLTADSTIRPLISVEEANNVIDFIKQIQFEYNANTKQRRDAFKRRLSTGKIEDAAFMYKQLYLYEHQDESFPIKYGPVDLEMLRELSNVLLEELSLVNDKPKEEVDNLIKEKIK